jgi:hypothetical protein
MFVRHIGYVDIAYVLAISKQASKQQLGAATDLLAAEMLPRSTTVQCGQLRPKQRRQS